MKKLEIFKNKKQIKSKTKKFIMNNLIDFDFSSIKKLKGNNNILEVIFQTEKRQILNNG